MWRNGSVNAKRAHPPQYLSSTCQAVRSHGGASVRIKDRPGVGDMSYSLPSIKKKNLKTFSSNSPKKALFLTKSSTVVALMIKSRNFEVLPLALKVDISEFHASLNSGPSSQGSDFDTNYPYLVIGAFVFLCDYGLQSLRGRQYFALGAVAKTVSTVVTYPLQVAQCRQRVSYSRRLTRAQHVPNTWSLTSCSGH